MRMILVCITGKQLYDMIHLAYALLVWTSRKRLYDMIYHDSSMQFASMPSAWILTLDPGSGNQEHADARFRVAGGK